VSVVAEAEAGGRWCPRRHYRPGGPNGPLDSANGCIGAACMAWRWAALDRHGNVYPRGSKASAEREAGEGRAPGQVVGYCGLAGLPQP